MFLLKIPGIKGNIALKQKWTQCVQTLLTFLTHASAIIHRVLNQMLLSQTPKMWNDRELQNKITINFETWKGKGTDCIHVLDLVINIVDRKCVILNLHYLIANSERS